MNAIGKIDTGARSFFDDWSKARKFLMPAIEMFRGAYTENDIMAGVLAGHYRLWLLDNSAVVTEISAVGRYKCINLKLAGGDRMEIVALENQIAEEGRANGCVWMTGRGRVGWAKDARDHGWTVDHSGGFKEL